MEIGTAVRKKTHGEVTSLRPKVTAVVPPAVAPTGREAALAVTKSMAAGPSKQAKGSDEEAVQEAAAVAVTMMATTMEMRRMSRQVWGLAVTPDARCC